MAVGFVGLGNLGKAIVGRLASERIDLVVWNRTKGKAPNMKVAESPSDLISSVELVFVCVSDSSAVKGVLTAKNGLLDGDCRGKIVVDLSTNHFEEVVAFYRLLHEKGAAYMECPVSGSVIPASRGELVVLVSGDRKSFDTARPYLEKIGKKIFYLERPGLATKMKLVTNLVLGSFMVTLAEAILLGESVGIGKEMVIDVLSAGAGNSALLNAKRGKLLEEDFSPHFSSAMMYKDLNYVEELARSLKRPLFTGIVARELFGKSFPAQIENLDFSAVYRILKEI